MNEMNLFDKAQEIIIISPVYQMDLSQVSSFIQIHVHLTENVHVEVPVTLFIPYLPSHIVFVFQTFFSHDEEKLNLTIHLHSGRCLVQSA